MAGSSNTVNQKICVFKKPSKHERIAD